MKHPIALIILDGFGIAAKTRDNAVFLAKTPNLNHWIETYPHTTLKASGTFVGLPDHFQGNSEVGHITIGAGRIIKQPLTIWLEAINNGSFYTNETLNNGLKQLKKNGNTIHIMGLLSDAGIHCYETLIYAAIDAAAQAEIKKIIVHVFLDGRDTPPQSAYHYLKKLEFHLKHLHHVTIGSLHGRFYAMDRDNNWDRTEKSYRILTEAQQGPYDSWEKILERNYAHNITDEFIEPIQLHPDAIIKNGDGILFCNIRPDRARQLTASFVQPHFTHFITKPCNLAFFITPIEYDKQLPTTILFHRPLIKNTLKDILTQHHKTIFSIAETEKYAHITYFFRGENEEAVETETRVLIPSIKTESYRNYPHMSAEEITDATLSSLQTNPKDFYLINYANADMVGHSGDFDATVKSIEFLDTQLKRLYDIIITKMNGTLFITADHGKAEEMFDEATHQPKTSHTTNPVPFIMINNTYAHSPFSLPLSQLADIAPFILKEMKLPIPEEMTHIQK